MGKSQIHSKIKCHVIEKIKKIHCKWQIIKKEIFKNITLIKRQNLFVNEFDNLFDIAHKNALTLIIQEDKEFIFAQRKKGGSMGPIDTKRIKKKSETKMTASK